MSSAVVDLSEMVPSAELLRVLGELDRSALDFEQQLAAIGATERLLGLCTALQHDLLADVELADELLAPGWDRGPSARWRAEQVGLALGITGASAQRRMSTATTLVEKLPAVTAALRVGAITVHHARVVARHADVLDAPVAQAAEALVMPGGDWRTPSQLERAFARAVMQVDPAGAAKRHEQARRCRRVSLRDEPDGMSSLWALLPAEQGQLVQQTIDAHARSSQARNTDGDHRTLDERRADALVELITRPYRPVDRRGSTSGSTGGAGPTGCGDCSHGGGPYGDGPHGGGPYGGGPHGGGPDGGGPYGGGPTGSGEGPGGAGGEPMLHGRSPQVHITVAWSTLIGLDDAPADLTGYGPITAATARRIAADPSSVWRRLITDPVTGQLLDYGRTTYTPPQDLVDFVMARDQYCRFPTCDRPAVLCDVDHRTPFDADGHTCPGNLDPLCRRHHRLKHEAGWTHHRDPVTGESTWTDPHGRPHHKAATVLPTSPPVEPPTVAPCNIDDVDEPPF